MTKIAIITDIHANAQHGTKRGDQAFTLLEQVLQKINALQPDLLIDLGDRINDTNPATDAMVLEALHHLFCNSEIPRVHLLGNHDVVNLSASENAKQLETNTESQVQELNDWNLVFWYCNPALTENGWNFRTSDLDWLRQALASERPSIIFTHAPFSGASMLGNYYFEPMPAFAGYSPTPELRSILENSRVELCIAGHCHWNTITYLDGIAHITVQSLTEGFTTNNQAAEAWALLELDQSLKLEVFGLDTWKIELPRRALYHWLKQSS
jgi:3',5'-cyclic-AMP phosphodiesterase